LVVRLAELVTHVDNFENHISGQILVEMASMTKIPSLEQKNENKLCFGISNNINESFLAMNSMVNGAEEPKKISESLQVCNSRKETLHSTRKISDVTSSSFSLDNLKYQPFESSQPHEFLGNKRQISGLSSEQKNLKSWKETDFPPKNPDKRKRHT